MALLLLPLVTCSCWGTKPVKHVRWHDQAFHLTVSDGGATTSFNWQVAAHSPGFFGTRVQPVFEAYGGPFLLDLRVEDSTLVLLANDGHGHPERIELDLRHLDALAADPVRYHRYGLEESNAFYHEPAFIKAQWEQEQQLNLESRQRHEERQAGRN